MTPDIDSISAPTQHAGLGIRSYVVYQLPLMQILELAVSPFAVHGYINCSEKLLVDWEGSAPICSITALLGPAGYYSSASCPKDHPDKLTTGKYGAGGEQPCKSNGGMKFSPKYVLTRICNATTCAGFKSFCCMDPIAWQNCAWYENQLISIKRFNVH